MTCQFQTPCHFHTCGFVTPHTCGFVSPFTCQFASGCGPTFHPTVCPAGSVDPPIDPGAIVIDPEDLQALREHLEAQLKDIAAAEQALKDREADK